MNGNKLSTMMKKSYIYTVVLSCIALVSGCVDIEEFEEPAQKVSKTFYAEMEDSPLTRTVLGDKGEDGIRPVLWMPEDKIGVAPSAGGAFDMFVNKSAESSVMAEFEGQTSLAPSYFAVYPYDKDAVVADGSISFTLNTEQKYKAGSFDEGAFPMIARSSDTNDDGLMFYNLCGVLEVNLTGEEKITKISFSSNNKVSGKFSVNANYKQYPEMVADASSLTSTTLDCGEGIQLKADSPTPFYFVLPPGTYDVFTLMIHTSDGKMMFKQSQKPLTIKRSTIIKSGALAYVESVSVDLSIRGTSNCYVVPGAGMYSFDASVIGNGSYGIISGASFHTEDPKITPTSVEVLWESTGAGIEASKGKLLTSVSLIDGRIHFVSTGVEGNALVAVKDSNGTILWSWHLWFTDTPQDQLYVNSVGTFTVQDRNLGATKADAGSGDEYKDSHGLLYQWGRKDPFKVDKFTYLTWKKTSSYSVEDIIKQPTSLSVAKSTYSSSANWTSQNIIDFWSESGKTIYDPCPVGYRVASSGVWTDFGDVSKLDNSYEHGLKVKYNESEYAWYAYTSYHEEWENRLNNAEGHIYIWSADQRITNATNQWTSETSLSYAKDNHNDGMKLTTDAGDVFALSVRCMKDDGHVDLALPVVEMVGAKDATAESVSLTFNVVNAGASSVTESGIIYSTTPGVSTGNGQKVAATGSEYKVDLTGLTEGTKYYAVAYATNTYGTSYSKEIAFYTKFASYINLSEYGTSNCYIVSESGAYTFDASVRGNSTESVGIPASVEVLWETKNTTKTSAGEIIRSGSVELSGDFVNFVANGVEGNALIAVKDALGTILWSWHIWVTDYPQDQHYINDSGDFYVLDRNLGATRADRGTGDEWKESSGFLYQWGRKDPFADGHYEWVQSQFTLKESIEKPMIYAARNSPWTYEWSDNLWDVSKTIYDPCPVGYKVSVQEIWNGFTVNGINVAGVFDYGWHFYIDSQNTAWYPANPHIGYMGHFEYHEDAGHAWCTTPSYIMEFSKSGLTIQSTASYQAFPVRCMREHEINIALNTEQATEVTKTSANIHGSMGYLGAANLLEMGFVWSSTNESPDINSSKIAVDVKEGEFSKSLTDLSPGTTYYVRTFATEGNITMYGNVVSFTTQVSAGNEDIPEDDEYEW